MSNRPPAAAPISDAMGRVLRNLYEGREAFGHLRGRSMHGAAGQTRRALVRRGWITAELGELVLTEAGREQAAGLVRP